MNVTGAQADIDRLLRLIAGFSVLLSLALAISIDPRWLWFTGFVGLNLFQSGFTDWCPMMAFLRERRLPGAEPGHTAL